MGQFTLGVNNCFAVKRWPEPAVWAAVCRERLGVEAVQYSLDLTDLGLASSVLTKQARRIRQACADQGLRIHSAFTGLNAYNSNLLLAPDAADRRAAVRWYRKALWFTTEIGGKMAGGHLGALSMTEAANPVTRTRRIDVLVEEVCALTQYAQELGLECLLLEPMPVARELTATIEATASLLERLSQGADIPVRLCPDLGHACAAGNRVPDNDPLAWLRRFARQSPAVHLQQTNGLADCHHAFTASENAAGIIHAAEVLRTLQEAGAGDTALLLEVIHPYEAAEETVLQELAASVQYWQAALQAEPV